VLIPIPFQPWIAKNPPLQTRRVHKPHLNHARDANFSFQIGETNLQNFPQETDPPIHRPLRRRGSSCSILPVFST
jgi:hypothetical protein